MTIFRIVNDRRWARCGLLAVLVISGCSPSLDWRQVSLDEASALSAQFPCKPVRHERTVRPTGSDVVLKVAMWSCEASGMNWALSKAEVAQPGDVPTTLAAWPQWTLANLEAATQGLSQPMAVEVKDLGAVAVPGMTPWPQARAWWMRTQRPDAAGQPLPVAVTSWHFAHGLSVYQAAVWRAGADAEAANGDEVMKAFFEGFQFRP